MSQIVADEVFVAEGPLYEVWGEDEMIVTFNCSVAARIGENYLFHKVAFPGHFIDEEGIARCAASRRQAQELVDRILESGLTLDLNYWNN